MESLAILAGVADAAEVVESEFEAHGFDPLQVPLQYYYAIKAYDAEVNNGGHSQYFLNSSGDHWKVALKGLKTIHATEVEAILRKAVALFGPNGPSIDPDVRGDQLMELEEQAPDALSDLDEKYYGCEEQLGLLLTQFVLENKAHFVLRK